MFSVHPKRGTRWEGEGYVVPWLCRGKGQGASWRGGATVKGGLAQELVALLFKQPDRSTLLY
jgi:hypothetical protein